MRNIRHSTRFLILLLSIEFIDELIGGAREAAWPLLRTDFALTYTEIGLMLSLPGVIGNLVEPVIGILADTWKRRVIILGGGCVFVLSSFLAAASPNAWWLLAAYVLFNPASGAFVSMSQAVLMDLEPTRHEQNMTRWTFAGSVGVVLGPLLVTGAVLLGTTWRVPYAITALAALVTLIFGWQAFLRAPVIPQQEQPTGMSLRQSLLTGLRGAVRALRRKEVLRWLTLLEFSDLMLDVLLKYIALYLVDGAGFSTAGAGAGVAILTGVGLIGDFLLIPLLERVPGLRYLRVSAALQLVVYPLFLIIDNVPVKLVLLGLCGFLNAGWYAILKGQLYSAMPGQSGTVTTVGNVFGLFGQMIPLGIGFVAQQFGLSAAMWLLALGPVALVLGIPRKE